ncbi:AAA family ATPase [Bacillus cereus]
MKLKKIIINGLFERNYNISFDEDITFLYGVNGCGKTTILNIISTIISGELLDLNNYNFEYLELIVSEFDLDSKEEKLIIKEIRDKTFGAYQIEFKNKRAMVPKTSLRHEWDYDEMGMGEAISKRKEYVEMKEDYFNKYLSDLAYEIQDAFYQLYIPLTRKSVSIDKLQVRNINTSTKIARKSDTNSYLDNSVKKAVRVLRDYMMEVTQRENQNLEMLKEQILNLALSSTEIEIKNLNLDELSHLDSDFEDIPSISNLHIPMKQNLMALKEKLESNRRSFEIDQNNNMKINSAIDFANFVSAMSQLKKFRQIAKAVNEANKRREEFLLPINQLINAINEFFIDGDKEISINPRGFLKFKRKGSRKLKPITLMSSGEKQIIIFFVYVILGLATEKRKGIFIIDEPELSLHVEWQNKFIPNLLKVAGGTQLILATHSPEIIGNMREKCEEVRGVL